jgi:hypothetical protein
MLAKDVKYLIDKLGETTPEAMNFITDMLHKQGLEGE